MTSPPPKLTLASFWHDLPRAGKLLLSIVVIEFLGTGLVLPFTVIYLNEVRGIPLARVGLLFALQPLLGLLTVGPGGALIDRIGARKVMLAALACQILGNILLAFAHTSALAAVALCIIGAAFGVTWPAIQTLIATIIPSPLRPRYFGVNFTLLNLGIGVGGLIGGLFVNVNSLASFQAIYLADAASYLPATMLLLGPLRHVAGRPDHHGDEPPPAEGYAAILRRPHVALLMAATFVGAFAGYAQLNTGAPAFARVVGGVSTRALGVGFAVNTLVIVLLQLVVLRYIEGRRRTRVMVVMAFIWSSSWLLLGVSGLIPGSLGAAVFLALFMGVFGLGETLLQPTMPALVNDLAPDHLRGRFNAISSASFQLPSVVAPPVAGFLIGHHLGAVYIAILVLCGLVLAILAGRLERGLPDAVNGRIADPGVDEVTPPPANSPQVSASG